MVLLLVGVFVIDFVDWKLLMMVIKQVVRDNIPEILISGWESEVQILGLVNFRVLVNQIRKPFGC